jgi:hypothetical protein
MASNLDIIGIGTNAIDQVIQLYRIPDADAKVSAHLKNITYLMAELWATP